MVAAVRHGMRQMMRQHPIPCVLAPAVIAAIYATKRPHVLSSPFTFFSAVAFPTIGLCRWHGWAWKTTLVASWFLSALAKTIAIRLQPRPSLSQNYPSDKTIDFTGQPFAFSTGQPAGRSGMLNFVKMTHNGQERLIPVYHERSTMQYTGSSPVNIYLHILAQEQTTPTSMSIKEFLSYWNAEAEKQFLEAIVSSRTNQNPPIFSFSPSRIAEVLQLPRCRDMELRSLLYTSAQRDGAGIIRGQSLFTAWVGKGHADLIRAMLTLYPSIIEQIQEPTFQNQKSILFSTATQFATKKDILTPKEVEHVTAAEILIQAMEAAHYTLSLEETNAKQAIAAKLARK